MHAWFHHLVHASPCPARRRPAGKQSLARLAAFICGYEVFQIAVSSTYGVPEFKAVSGGGWLLCNAGLAAQPMTARHNRSASCRALCHQPTPAHTLLAHYPLPAARPQDLLSLYQKAGAKGTPVVFLLTDNQLTKEAFLVYINDLLANGDVPDLCSAEDRDAFCNAVRGRAGGRVGGHRKQRRRCDKQEVGRCCQAGLACRQRLAALPGVLCSPACGRLLCCPAGAQRGQGGGPAGHARGLLAVLHRARAAQPARGAVLQPGGRQVPRARPPVPRPGQLHRV